MKNRFTYNNMDFEIYRNTGFEAGIKLLGECNKLILYNLPENITVEIAKILVEGFFKGYEQGHREGINAINSLKNKSLIRQYYGVV